MATQRQSSGESSTNIQAGRDVTITGITVSDAREIAQQVFEANFLTLTDAARTVAKERAEEITREFIRRLVRLGEERLAVLVDPDIQASLYRVQHDYARSGQEDLGSVLVQLLVERCLSEDQSWESLILSDAIETARRLKPTALAALSAVAILKYGTASRLQISTADTVSASREYVTILQSFCDAVPRLKAEWEYLHYCGVTTPLRDFQSFRDNLPRAILAEFPKRPAPHWLTVKELLEEIQFDLSKELSVSGLRDVIEALSPLLTEGPNLKDYSNGGTPEADGWRGLLELSVQIKSGATLSDDELAVMHSVLKDYIRWPTYRHDWPKDRYDASYGYPGYTGRERGRNQNRKRKLELERDYLKKQFNSVTGSAPKSTLAEDPAPLMKSDPLWRSLESIWNNTTLSQVDVTAVGLALGHSNLVRTRPSIVPLRSWLKIT